MVRPSEGVESDTMPTEGRTHLADGELHHPEQTAPRRAASPEPDHPPRKRRLHAGVLDGRRR